MMSLNTSSPRGPAWCIAAWLAGYAAVLGGGVCVVLAPGHAAHADRGDSVVVASASDVLRPAIAQAAVTFAEGGILKGTVKFTDDAKALKPLVTKGDASVKDAAVCAAADVPDESLVVSPDNKGIANVFIFLAKAPVGYKAGKPTGDVVFDQKGCQFLPHGLCVQVGQTVKVLSDDAVPHNTHTFPLRNAGFNQTISPNDRKGVELKYAKAEKLPIEVKCDFHTWMKAYHLIMDHPFMAVTDASGHFEIKGLPAGKHEFIVWHEKKGYLDRKYAVEIKAGADSEVELKYGEKNFASFDGPRPRSITVSLGN